MQTAMESHHAAEIAGSNGASPEKERNSDANQYDQLY